MFDVSFTELIIIGVVALIVIGPERLPKVARTAGHLLGRAQRYVSEVKSDIQREINLDEVNKLKDQMEEAARSVRTSVQDTGKSLSEPLDQARDALQQASDSARSALSTQPAAQATGQPETPGATTPAPASDVTDKAASADSPVDATQTTSAPSAAPAASDTPAHAPAHISKGPSA
ncbi:Sec-independent protein translocase protein TatB [Alcaligenes sp. SDU_A2]|uniref:Sec-independent protein translocase protein TatB n=1 Tax=Alcaligenes sp. SDU_A2 TaxID=3136634 RepID=UPI002C5CDA6F|nr:Sec-independent protein translocase protein TatB [Alcaligenes sp.]HRL26053.1 Sec-independent protein translocase protein TatB [Alcaligenes sp.]